MDTVKLNLNQAVEEVARRVEERVTIDIPTDPDIDTEDITYRTRRNTQLIGLVRISAPSILLAVYDEVAAQVSPAAEAQLKARLGLGSLRK